MRIDSSAYLPVTEELNEKLFTSLKVTNPKYLAAVRFSNSRYGEKPPRFIFGYKTLNEDTFQVPRSWALKNLESDTIKLSTTSVYAEYPEPKYQLFDYQETAADAYFDLVNANDEAGLPTDSMIVMATSGGKTMLAMQIAYHTMERCLVVVPTVEIENGWRADLNKTFGLGPKDIGSIRAGKFTIGDQFTIGSIQTLMKMPKEQWANTFGLTIMDEVHRFPGEQFIKVLERSDSKLRLGLTATDVRKDGLMPAVHWHLGMPCYKDTTPRNSVPLTYRQIVSNVSVPPKNLGRGQVEYEWNDTLSKLIISEDYNNLLLDTLNMALKVGGSALLTSCRTEHLFTLYRMLPPELSKEAVIITGSGCHVGGEELTKVNRTDVFKSVKEGKYKVTLATQSIMAEGASVPKWWHTIIGTPFSDPKTMIQLKGRPIRKEDPPTTKEAGYVWDVVPNVVMLRSMARTRLSAVRPHARTVEFYEHSTSGIKRMNT